MAVVVVPWRGGCSHRHRAWSWVKRRYRERVRRFRLRPVYPNQFQCALCMLVFNKNWSDAEAAAEAKDLFGMDEPEQEGVLVCDDCFRDPRNPQARAIEMEFHRMFR